MPNRPTRKPPQPESEVPSFLAQALKAKERAEVKRQEAAANLKMLAAKGAKPEKTSLPARLKQAGKGEKASLRHEHGATVAKIAPVPEQLQGDLDDPREAAMAVFRRFATNQEALRATADDLPQVLSALVTGAKIPGRNGASDRTMLFRMLGLPWMAIGAGISAKDVGEAIGNRLGDAIARFEARGRRVPATLDAETVEEPPADAASTQVAHLIEDQGAEPEPPRQTAEEAQRLADELRAEMAEGQGAARRPQEADEGDRLGW